jgi:hypothetical protein
MSPMGEDSPDLASVLSRVEQVERRLAAQRAAAAELADLRARSEQLDRQNAALAATVYQLSGKDLRRLLIGLAIIGIAGFDLVASYGAPGGFPPFMRLEGAVVAALGGLVGASIIGFFGPHRVIALGALALTGALLVSKPYAAPCVYDWMGERSVFSLNSETHYYFFVPGILALVLTALLALGTRGRS